MTVSVSTNYRRLTPGEVPIVAAECDAAWKSAVIPRRQWVSVVRGELERYREGQKQRHFDVLIETLQKTGLDNPKVLEVGASSGFYSEVFKIAGYRCQYTAMDYSEEYEKLAYELFPDIDFKVGDARDIPYPDDSFSIVISGCVIIHIYEWEKAIAEAARVAKDYVVMSRTPVTYSEPTTWFQKDAYSVPCLEAHFNQSELFDSFARCGLDYVSELTTYDDPENHYCQKTYLLAKRKPLQHHPV